MAAVALLGTLDTKGPDLAFMAERLRAAGAAVIVVDAGTGEPDGLAPDIDGEGSRPRRGPAGPCCARPVTAAGR